MRILTIALIAASFHVTAQHQTTESEYLYLTKGLIDVLEKGHDPKSGYTLAETQPVTYGNYVFTFRPFIKDDTQELVGLSVRAQSNVWPKNTFYLCIPRNNNELLTRYRNHFRQMGPDMTASYLDVLSNITVEALANAK